MGIKRISLKNIHSQVKKNYSLGVLKTNFDKYVCVVDGLYKGVKRCRKISKLSSRPEITWYENEPGKIFCYLTQQRQH